MSWTSDSCAQIHEELWDPLPGAWDPLPGGCADASGNFYSNVNTLTGWDGATVTSCFDFCESLPGFNDQLGLNTNFELGKCYCSYDAGTLPSAGQLPSGVVRNEKSNLVFKDFLPAEDSTSWTLALNINPSDGNDAGCKLRPCVLTNTHIFL